MFTNTYLEAKTIEHKVMYQAHIQMCAKLSTRQTVATLKNQNMTPFAFMVI